MNIVYLVCSWSGTKSPVNKIIQCFISVYTVPERDRHPMLHLSDLGGRLSSYLDDLIANIGIITGATQTFYSKTLSNRGYYQPLHYFCQKYP